MAPVHNALFVGCIHAISLFIASSSLASASETQYPQIRINGQKTLNVTNASGIYHLECNFTGRNSIVRWYAITINSTRTLIPDPSNYTYNPSHTMLSCSVSFDERNATRVVRYVHIISDNSALNVGPIDSGSKVPVSAIVLPIVLLLVVFILLFVGLYWFKLRKHSKDSIAQDGQRASSSGAQVHSNVVQSQDNPVGIYEVINQQSGTGETSVVKSKGEPDAIYTQVNKPKVKPDVVDYSNGNVDLTEQSKDDGEYDYIIPLNTSSHEYDNVPVNRKPHGSKKEMVYVALDLPDSNPSDPIRGNETQTVYADIDFQNRPSYNTVV